MIKYRALNLDVAIREQRAELLSAIHSIIHHWVNNGTTLGVPQRRFPKWEQIIRGILESIGIDCLYDNIDTFEEDAENARWIPFFNDLHERFGDAGFTSTEFLNAYIPDYKIVDWDEFEPEEGELDIRMLFDYDLKAKPTPRKISAMLQPLVNKHVGQFYVERIKHPPQTKYPDTFKLILTEQHSDDIDIENREELQDDIPF